MRGAEGMLVLVLAFPLQPQDDIEEIIQKINRNEEVINENKRPRRQAAIKATELRKRLLDEDAL